jgi:hypothetical protein
MPDPDATGTMGLDRRQLGRRLVTETQSPPPRRGRRANTLLHEAAGALMALTGSLVLLGLVYISNDPAPFAEHLLFSLGLALTSLISAAAQILVIVGIVVLWNAARRGRKDS